MIVRAATPPTSPVARDPLAPRCAAGCAAPGRIADNGRHAHCESTPLPMIRAAHYRGKASPSRAGPRGTRAARRGRRSPRSTRGSPGAGRRARPRARLRIRHGAARTARALRSRGSSCTASTGFAATATRKSCCATRAERGLPVDAPARAHAADDRVRRRRARACRSPTSRSISSTARSRGSTSATRSASCAT